MQLKTLEKSTIIYKEMQKEKIKSKNNKKLQKTKDVSPPNKQKTKQKQTKR